MSFLPEYDNNILIDALGPIRTPFSISDKYLYLPPVPVDTSALPFHVRVHALYSLVKMFVPSHENVRIATTIDLMLRQGYISRNPAEPKSWHHVYADPKSESLIQIPTLASSVTGISGVGKSSSIERALHSYQQVVTHARYPNLIGSHKQLVWLKADISDDGGGKALALDLMRQTDEVLGTGYFSGYTHATANGTILLSQWRRIALLHGLGILVLDEIDNLFKIPTVEERRRNRSKNVIRIIEDQTLKWLISLSNTYGIPVMYSGTQEAIRMFGSRFATAQRSTFLGLHEIQHFESPNDPQYAEQLFPLLCEYQWLDEKMPPTDELRCLLHDLSGGVMRIMLSLWSLAQRHALERGARCMCFSDLQHVMATSLQNLNNAISALKSNDPDRLARYTDLMRNID